ncbi:MAG: DUF4412 domain-containing protein [Verrucomicrobia bacterium]|nr:DUF4412 domain-containing protein [Verrucomicrobiota bacterium]
MKKLLTVIAVFAISIHYAKADFILKEDIESAGQVEPMTLYLKEMKCRLDVSARTSAIIDSATGDMIVLIPQQKIYLRISAEQLKAQADAMKNIAAGQGSKNDIQLTPTGNRQTISGHDTEEYQATINGVKSKIFIAKDFPDYLPLVTALYNLQNGPGLEAFRMMPIPPEKYPGMPMRTEVDVMGQKITTTVTSVEQVPIADSEFSVPSDFKELSASKLLNGAHPKTQ